MLRLAGYALAHAIWSIEDGETLATLAMTDIRGERMLHRFVDDTIPATVDRARLELRRLLGEGDSAALIFDGYATAEGGGRTDALAVEVLRGGGVPVGYILQPYRPARRRILLIGRPSGFALLELPSVMDGFDVPDPESYVMAGVREHGKADRHYDAMIARGS